MVVERNIARQFVQYLTILGAGVAMFILQIDAIIGTHDGGIGVNGEVTEKKYGANSRIVFVYMQQGKFKTGKILARKYGRKTKVL